MNRPSSQARWRTSQTDSRQDAGRAGHGKSDGAIDSAVPASPAPPPPPPGVLPASSPDVTPPPVSRVEAYIGYLRHELPGGQGRSKSYGDCQAVTTQDERRLVQDGVHQFGLSSVFAGHLLQDVAAHTGCQLASDSARQPNSATTLTGVEPQTLERFFAEATVILSSHRGLNAQSRIKLSAIGDKLELTDEQTEQAIVELQRRLAQPADRRHPEARQRERQEAYRIHLQRLLDELPRDVVTAGVHQQLLTVGRERHGVDEQRLESLVAEVAAQRNVRVISRSQAEEHVAGLVQEIFSQHEDRADEYLNRVYTEGAQWGLDFEQVSRVLSQQMDGRRKQLATRRRRTAIGIAFASGLATLVVLITMAAAMWSDLRDSRAAVSGFSQIETPDAAGEMDTEVIEAEGRGWADDTLHHNMARAQALLPQHRRTFQQLRQGNKTDRHEAARELVEAFERLPTQGSVMTYLRTTLSGTLAMEPSDDNARRLRESLLRQIPERHDPLPSSSRTWLTAFRAVEVLDGAGRWPNMDPQRGELLRRDVAHRLGMSASDVEPEYALHRALILRFYGQLIEMGPDQPERALRLVEWLHDRATGVLGPEAVEFHEAEVAYTVVPHSGSGWSLGARLLRRVTRAESPATTLRMVELYEKTGDSGLQQFLGNLLQQQLADGQAGGRDHVAGMLRNQLGAEIPYQSTQGWRTLVETARQQLDDLPDSDRPLDERLEALVHLNYLATLACAMQRPQQGASVVERLESEGRPQLHGGVGETARNTASRRPGRNRSTVEGLRRSVGRLVEHTQPNLRLLYLDRLSRSIPQIDDLDVESAQLLADYLVESKPPAEHQQVLTVLDSLASAPQVRLALADQMRSVNRPDDQLTELVHRLLARTFPTDPPSQWVDDVRRELMQSALASLREAGDAEPREANELWDVARDQLTSQYRRQANVLGVPTEETKDGKSPSHLLATIGSHQAMVADAAGLDIAAADRFRRELAAIEYLANGDLQRTVLLQRAWLELLLAGLRADNLQHVDRLDDLGQNFVETDVAAADILDQLIAGEAALLRVWLWAESLP